ncbi:MAG: phytanoyl-CoA dioxygenase family protein, partial [Verrucomicrobia bacterium]|nr:phytanoyl-CoA dioxygenase family protein [Verrucomicrobiota bacterium]
NAGPQTMGHKGATLDYRKIQDLEWDLLFLTFSQHPLVRHICEVVYGVGVDVSIFRAMFMNKPVHKGTLLPWHQDRWSNLDKDPLVTLWTALDPATIANGCVQIIPKSHHRLINPDHASGFLTDDMAKEHCKAEGRVFLELEVGESVLLHNWLLHSSDVNRTSQSRRAFSASYMRSDTLQDGKPNTYPVIFGKGELTQADLFAHKG